MIDSDRMHITTHSVLDPSDVAWRVRSSRLALVLFARTRVITHGLQEPGLVTASKLCIPGGKSSTYVETETEHD